MSKHEAVEIGPTPIPYSKFRWLVFTVILLTVLVGIGGVFIIDAVHDATRAQQSGHAQRIAEDEELKAAITALQKQTSQLACVIISQTPNNPLVPAIQEFREFYKCPAFSKKDPFKNLKTPGSGVSTNVGSSQPPTPSVAPAHAKPSTTPASKSSSSKASAAKQSMPTTSHPSPTPSTPSPTPIARISISLPPACVPGVICVNG